MPLLHVWLNVCVHRMDHSRSPRNSRLQLRLVVDRNKSTATTLDKNTEALADRNIVALVDTNTAAPPGRAAAPDTAA